METVVSTKYGKVKGYKSEDIMKWKGIPYAAAPVGELRFKRAKEHVGWTGELDCTQYGAKCWQFGGGKFQHLLDSPNPASEDCLFLNVWSKEKFKKRPVFVWIHGGGQYSGEASNPDYDLKNFARDGVVGVSFNYRLGVLGFYDFSKYDKEVFESNCAISDMIMALKWVHDNIENFGGDPENVTLCGESAGATCTMALLASEEARKYFRRAVIMSGVYSNIVWSPIQEYNQKIFFEESGIAPGDVDALMDADYETLLAGCRCRFDGTRSDIPGMLTCGPVIDDIITETPMKAIRAGKLDDKEIMIGTCRNEGGLFEYMQLGFKSWDDAMNVLEREGYEKLIPKFTRAYLDRGEGEEKERRALMVFNGDFKFWADSVKLAKEAAKHTRVYMYRFDYTTPVSKLLKIGATHTMDITAAFDVKGAKLYKFAVTDSVVKDKLHKHFMNFIKTGNPNDEGSRVWPSFKESSQRTMIVDRESTIVSAPREAYAKLWKEIELS